TDRSEWDAALAASQKRDAASPSPATKFFVGVSSFSIGFIALQNANELGKVTGRDARDARDARAKACAEAKVIEDMWATAQANILLGGRFNPEGVAQVMAAIQQDAEYPPQMKRTYCTGR